VECPCSSQKKYEDCCAPFHEGKKAPATAEELMRSRYSAFVKHEIDYIVDTHHPETRSSVDKDEIEVWAKDSDWKGLEILGTQAGQSGDVEGLVDFVANYEAKGEEVTHKERSLFKKHEGTWYFFNAASLDPVKRDGPKIGRNDPCTCGSGKKFKKCCINKF